MGYPEQLRVRDDAKAQEEDVVSEVLRVAREPVGAGGDEAVPEAQGIDRRMTMYAAADRIHRIGDPYRSSV